MLKAHLSNVQRGGCLLSYHLWHVLLHRGRVNEYFLPISTKVRKVIAGRFIKPHTRKWISSVLFWASYRTNEIYLYVSSVIKSHYNINLLGSKIVSLFYVAWINFTPYSPLYKTMLSYHFAKVKSWLCQRTVFKVCRDITAGLCPVLMSTKL